jgi:hypothetical protein
MRMGKMKSKEKTSTVHNCTKARFRLGVEREAVRNVLGKFTGIAGAAPSQSSLTDRNCAPVQAHAIWTMLVSPKKERKSLLPLRGSIPSRTGVPAQRFGKVHGYFRCGPTAIEPIYAWFVTCILRHRLVCFECSDQIEYN